MNPGEIASSRSTVDKEGTLCMGGGDVLQKTRLPCVSARIYVSVKLVSSFLITICTVFCGGHIWSTLLELQSFLG